MDAIGIVVGVLLCFAIAMGCVFFISLPVSKLAKAFLFVIGSVCWTGLYTLAILAAIIFFPSVGEIHRSFPHVFEVLVLLLGVTTMATALKGNRIYYVS